MSIPMRIRNPVFSPRAPASSVAIPGPWDTWRPTPLRLSKGGVKVLQLVPRLGRINPGWLVAGFLADLVLREAAYAAYLWLNGLTLQQYCFPLPVACWSGGNTCSTGQARGLPMAALPNQVAGMAPGGTISFLGFTNYVSGGVSWRGRVQSIWVADGTNVGGRRARPFYTTVQRPTVTSVAATAARPGHVPYDVKPWPVGKLGNPPYGPQPTPEVEPMGRPAPGVRWSYNGFGSRPQVQRIDRVNTPARAVTRVTTNEIKIGANTQAGQFFFTLMRAREAVSEIMDIGDVLFQSLPYWTQRRYGGATASDHDKLRAVFENLGSIDAGLFLKGLVTNQIEDEIIGRTYIKTRGAVRNKLFGNQIGSLGPLVNDAFKAYSKHVSDLSKAITDQMFGEQSHAAERDFNNLLWKTENALRDLRKSANQLRPSPANPGTR